MLERYFLVVMFVSLMAWPLEASVRDLWVDPVNGSDSNSGASRALAFRTITAAWDLVPSSVPLMEGVRIQLVAGTYSRSSMPTYWERRYGSSDAPIIIQAAD